MRIHRIVEVIRYLRPPLHHVVGEPPQKVGVQLGPAVADPSPAASATAQDLIFGPDIGTDSLAGGSKSSGYEAPAPSQTPGDLFDVGAPILLMR